MKHFLIYLALSLLMPISIEAKKKPFGNGLYWELSDNGVLTISGNGKMPDFGYKKHKSPWRRKAEMIHKVVISHGVTSIGSWAFGDYGSNYHFQSIEIPNSVTCIGEYNQEIKGKTNVEIIPVSA